MKIPQSIRDNYWLIVIIVAAAALRMHAIDFQSLWLDEVLSMNDARPGLTISQSIESVMKWEDFPALYFLSLKFWMSIFGYSPTVARMFSAVIGVLGVYGMFLLGREFSGRRGGLFAAVLTAVNLFHIGYSQEIRPYGLFFLFAVLSFYRLSRLIKNPTYKNGVFYGIFAGLMLNAHLIGLLTLFAQCLLLLFFLIKISDGLRKKFFISALLAGFTTAVLFWPCITTLQDISGIKSFWISAPKPDSFTLIFNEFFSYSELLIFAFSGIALIYFVTLFSQKSETTYQGILGNKMIYGFLIMVVWLTVSIVIPVIKSYTDVSILLTRYFISMLPVLLLVLAFGIDAVRSRFTRTVIVAIVIVLSMVDLFIVKDYYNTPTKTQYRELVRDLVSKNVDDAKVVAFWTWIYPYFVPEGSSLTFEYTLSMEDYVGKLRAGQVPESAFWFTDANGRPFALTPEAQAYLDEKFILTHKLEYIDVWANYYVPKNTPKTEIDPMNLSMFRRANFDNSGNIVFYNDAHVYSPLLDLEQGSYELAITGRSLPETPIRDENAHIQVRFDGRQIGQFYLGVTDEKENIVRFSVEATGKSRLVLSFDNDFFADGQDRNAVITSVRIQKK